MSIEPRAIVGRRLTSLLRICWRILLRLFERSTREEEVDAFSCFQQEETVKFTEVGVRVYKTTCV